MDPQEKRYSERRVTEDFSVLLRPLNPQEWFKFWDGVEYWVRDLSLVGVGLYSKQAFPKGTHMSIDLRLGADNPTIRIFGKVVWVQKMGEEHYRTGVSFSWWKDDADKKTVDIFIKKIDATAQS